MKLTYEIPGILIDNTKAEALEELITKASASLSVSGSFLASDGENHFVVKPFSEITSSVLHEVTANAPLAVINTDPIRPTVYLSGIVPILKGGTGKNSVENEKFLIGRSGNFSFINIVGGLGTSVNNNTDGNLEVTNKLYTDIQTKKTFFAANVSNNSVPGFRAISDDDIPSTLTNKILTNSTLSGSTSGSHKGTFSGAFIGDGSGLSDINIGNFSGILSASSGGTGKNNLELNSILMGNDSDPVKTFKGSLVTDKFSLVWNNSTNSFALQQRATLLGNTFNGDQNVVGNVTASYYIGDGSLLTNLSGNQFTTFKADILSQLSGSGSVSIDENGVIFSNGGGLSTVYTTGSITGSGEEDNRVRLKDDIYLNSVTASFSGDGSGVYNVIPTVKFTSSSGPVSVGDVVAISPDGLAKCNNSSDTLSNVIGTVYFSGSGEILVQTSGESTVTVNGSCSTGSMIYAGSTGDVVTYDQLASGDYVTQVGFISGNGIGKIIIQPRIFGQLA